MQTEETSTFWAWCRETGKKKWVRVAIGTHDKCRDAIRSHAAASGWRCLDSLLTRVGEDPNGRKK